MRSFLLKKSYQGTSLNTNQIAYYFYLFKRYIHVNICYEIIQPLLVNLTNRRGYSSIKSMSGQFHRVLVSSIEEISKEMKELNAHMDTAKLIFLLEEHREKLSEENKITSINDEAFLSVEFTQLWVSLTAVVFGNQFHKYVVEHKTAKDQYLRSIELWKFKKKQIEEGMINLQANSQFYYEELLKFKEKGIRPLELCEIIRCFFFSMENTRSEL